VQLLLADQLGPHFAKDKNLLLPIVDGQFAKRNYHRQKAHLIRYAQYRRAQDEGVELVRLESYRDLGTFGNVSSVVQPTSRSFLALANSLGLQVLSTEGFCSSFEDWQQHLGATKNRLRLEEFYRFQRSRLNILMDGGGPTGGAWNFDAENRLPPPKSGVGAPDPWVAVEDEIDAQVRKELDELESKGLAKFIGSDGPRVFPGSRQEALEALDQFVNNRLDLFGPYEDAVDKNDWAMAHSLLSVPMNLGLLSPIEVVRKAEAAYLSGTARLESVEGFIRQIIGWRDYVWHLYWQFGETYIENNKLEANKPLPESWKHLSGDKIQAKCLSHTIDQVNKHAWDHHIPRLMILGNAAIQRGYIPKQVNDWFIDAFADGYEWVMPANVIGMSLYADGGMMSTKPYIAGGAYLKKMTNFCSGCPLNPAKRVGEDACPYTAGYWNFLDQHRERFRSNHRMSQPLAGLRRLTDLEEIRIQEHNRESM
jgi:deoxyribodipyrimidine photolyase-related protein